MNDRESQDWLAAAKDAALGAARVLDDWRPRFTVREKGRSDLVTEADEASQKFIRDFLLTRFPGHQFLGEEGPASKRPLIDAPPTWIVDPIDGTTNFVHDVPFYCISIGLQIAGEIAVGVIFDPCLGEMFHAVRGEGAWLGERQLHVTATARLEEALIAVGFPADMRGHERLFDYWRYFALRCQALRRTGSTALNLAYVAAGRFDVFWADTCKAWDVAAGVLLVWEAGGTVTHFGEGNYDHFQGEILASNGALHAMIQSGFTGASRL